MNVLAKQENGTRIGTTVVDMGTEVRYLVDRGSSAVSAGLVRKTGFLSALPPRSVFSMSYVCHTTSRRGTSLGRCALLCSGPDPRPRLGYLVS